MKTNQISCCSITTQRILSHWLTHWYSQLKWLLLLLEFSHMKGLPFLLITENSSFSFSNPLWEITAVSIPVFFFFFLIKVNLKKHSLFPYIKVNEIFKNYTRIFICKNNLHSLYKFHTVTIGGKYSLSDCCSFCPLVQDLWRTQKATSSLQLSKCLQRIGKGPFSMSSLDFAVQCSA